MGLFDYVRCDYPLVDGAPVDGYQTKDMPWPFMERYHITTDGRLLHEEYDTEDQSDPNAPPGSLASLRGIMARVNQRWVEVPYHGDLSFYNGDWHFVMRFTEGRVTRLLSPKERAARLATEWEAR